MVEAEGPRGEPMIAVSAARISNYAGLKVP